ncbi:peptidylprolyl isomerase [Polluticaenibacter yanchengensis]|uniref:Peptidylprolyl isomerase n=1 Tax=Polluticaenibacter yanchengensis TaxID=3014562 RepID=A0ABT4UHD9_9BACT|nr:peptidylprolyl isomerase [Chitinophagaceae bacterium LY-5]
MKKIIFILATILITVTQLSAQAKKFVVDQIVGKVGDRIILKSDISNAIEDARRQGMELPENPNCAFMESELVKKALVLQAEKDSITIDEEEIEAKIDMQIRSFIQNYGSREALEDIAGRSIDQLKEDFKRPFKERELANKMREKILETIKISPIEVKAYFDGIPKDSLPYYESELEIGKIVVYPKPDREVESYAAKELNDIKKQAESGKPFERLASLYSEDKGTEQQGGVLNLNRNDKQWDPAFFQTAFKLKEGQISNVVKSKFGFHIIKVISKNGDDIAVRHILKIPMVTDDEVKESIEKLDSVRSKLIAGTIQFGEAVSKYSEDDDDKFSGGMVLGPDGSSYVTIDQLDKNMIAVIKDMKPGQYSQPLKMKDNNGKDCVAIIYLRNRTNPHVANLKDDYNKISQHALAEKKQNTLTKWFAERINTYYIFLDPSYSGCDDLGPWLKASVKN